MSKKFVAKLIATVMAMTMVVGMGTTAFAAGPSTCNDLFDDIQTKAAELALLQPVTTPEYINQWEAGSECYDATKLDAAFELANGVSAIRNPADHGHNPDGSECTSGPAATAVQSYYDNFIAKYNAVKNEKLVSDGSDYHACGSDPAPSTPAAPTAEQLAEEAAKVVEATIAKEEALPVTSFASTAAVNAIPAEAKAGNDATFNISAVTTTQGFVAAVNKIAKASVVAPAVSVYSSKPIAMNATALSAVAKTGKAFVYTFSYKGHIYKVTIPAGAKVVTNGQAFVGPLAIGAQLGTTQIVK